jgi:hypothetical protein
MNRTLSIVVAALAGLMILILAFVFYLMLTDTLAEDNVAQATVKPTEVNSVATEQGSSSLPTAAVEIQPTATVPPSPTPTDTPPPTETPLPTDTPVPPTNTPVPVVIVPTNPPPPPTNTPEPAPPPADTRGLVGTHFDIQWERSNPAVNQSVWFEFTVENITGGDVVYSRLGAMPKKDGVDRPEWFQQSWGGQGATLKPQGLDHEDHIKLPESGNYTLRLAICFEDLAICQGGGANWVTLSHEIPVTIN